MLSTVCAGKPEVLSIIHWLGNLCPFWLTCPQLFKTSRHASCAVSFLYHNNYYRVLLSPLLHHFRALLPQRMTFNWHKHPDHHVCPSAYTIKCSKEASDSSCTCESGSFNFEEQWYNQTTNTVRKSLKARGSAQSGSDSFCARTRLYNAEQHSSAKGGKLLLY